MLQNFFVRLAKILTPALALALKGLLERFAARIETRSAIKASKSAKTAAQLRDASKRISDASSRDLS